MDPPRFRTFPKIGGQPAGAIGGTWVATEKIHGAHLVLAVAGDAVHFGKRKAWLEPGSAFFGWQLVATELAEAMRRVAQPAGARQLFGYGELFGGAYPHPDVAVVEGLSAVQTGIWYAPDLRWSLFDVLVATGDDDEGELLAYRDVEDLARGSGLSTPPVLGRGRPAELERLPVSFQTHLPARFGLPPIEGNVAEGLVLKPDQRMRAAERPALKRKIPEFDDARFDESAPWDPGNVGFDALAAWADRLVNPARVASARSKVGVDPAAIVDELVLEVAIDLEATFGEAWGALDAASQQRLLDRIHAAASVAVGGGRRRARAVRS